MGRLVAYTDLEGYQSMMNEDIILEIEPHENGSIITYKKYYEVKTNGEFPTNTILVKESVTTLSERLGMPFEK